jgi:hypothetical protein
MSRSGQEPLVASCEHGYESSGSMKDREFLDYLSDYWLVKDIAPWH